MTVRDDAIKAVDAEWRCATEIFARVGCWAYTSVANNLNQAAIAGEIERREAPIPAGFRYEYRIKASA